MESIQRIDFIKAMHVAYEIQRTKSANKCGHICVKKFINQRNDMILCGAAVIFSAITMSDFTITTKINDPLLRLDE